jgi:hypothetical protein
MTKAKKTTVSYIAVLAALALALLLTWASFHPRALAGIKDLTLNVHHSDGTIVSFPLDTNARYLQEALETCEFMELGETDYGMRVLAADEEYAEWTEGVFWVFTVNGEVPEERADALPLSDGDVFDYYCLTY